MVDGSPEILRTRLLRGQTLAHAERQQLAVVLVGLANNGEELKPVEAALAGTALLRKSGLDARGFERAEVQPWRHCKPVGRPKGWRFA